MHANSSPYGIDHPDEPDSGGEVDSNLFLDRGSSLRWGSYFNHKVRSELRIGVFIQPDAIAPDKGKVRSKQSVRLTFEDEAALIVDDAQSMLCNEVAQVPS